MILPKIGNTVTTDQAIKLSRHFGLEHIADRIAAAPDKYHDWEFDGCSGLPDEVMGFFTGCRWEDITYKCCLPHDLGYAYGALGDETERKAVDEKFYADLIQEAGMQAWCAKAFLAAVRVGGAEVFGLSFSWGFAQT